MRSFDVLNDRWTNFRPTKVQAFWFAAACVAATLIFGFAVAGWVTAGTAEENRVTAASEARMELATAVCVDKFMQAEGAKARLAELEEMSWYARSDRVATEGWATMPDREQPNGTVAIMCATEISENHATAKGT